MKALVLTSMSLAGIPLTGFAVSRLWSWFVAAQFHLPTISVAEGFGIALLVAVLTSQYTPNVDEDDEVMRVAYNLVTPIVALAIGWATKQWWL